MIAYLQECITGPNLVATALLAMVMLYWLMVMIGALDLEFFDFDLDLDGEPDSILSIGFVGLKFLNIGNVPFMIWVSLFALAFWIASMLFWFARDAALYKPGMWYDLQYVLRNGAIALVVAKLGTQPMIPWFENEEYTVDELIGGLCTISTSVCSSDFGQARYETDGAPMLLDVRTVEGKLAKGDRARIVDYDADKKTYLISQVKQEV